MNEPSTQTRSSAPDGAHALLLTPNNEVLLVTKGPYYRFDPRNAGKVAMFGGGIEPGESPGEALRRELIEELELDAPARTVTPLGTFAKTREEDGMSCAIHVFLVYDVDPRALTLHEGAFEDDPSVPPGHHETIVHGTVEALLARDDLTRMTRRALEEHLLTRCTRNRSENAACIEEFEAGLTFPPARTRPQFLLCPIGEIGAGKTTVLRPLAERLGLLRSAGDDLRKVLREHGLGFNDTHDCMEGLLWRYVRAGFSVAIDGDCSSTRMQHVIRALERSYGVALFWVQVDPPEAYILDKLRHYPHTWLFRDGRHAVESYTKRKAIRPHPDVPFIYTFDPSRADLPAQIDEAERRIRAALANTPPSDSGAC